MNFIEGGSRLTATARPSSAGDRRLPLDGYAFAARPRAGAGGHARRAAGASGDRGAGTWAGFTVDMVEPMGADTLVWCSDGELTLEVRLPGERMMAPGAPVSLGHRPHPHLAVRRRGRRSASEPDRNDPA